MKTAQMARYRNPRIHLPRLGFKHTHKKKKLKKLIIIIGPKYMKFLWEKNQKTEMNEANSFT